MKIENHPRDLCLRQQQKNLPSSICGDGSYHQISTYIMAQANKKLLFNYSPIQNIYMKKLCILLLLHLLTYRVYSQDKKMNITLVAALKQMALTDQEVANSAFPSGKYQHYSQQQWHQRKDSVFRAHKKRLEIIFNTYGFPGYDLAGNEGTQNFWLMVQHCDFDPSFQNRVLIKMEEEVYKKNAPADKYGWLVDRVRLNTGKKQVYGSQVRYNLETCQAYPMPLADSAQVNKRRAKLGMGPIEVYLNNMSETHFEMNKKTYQDKGIHRPKLYAVPQAYH